MSKIINYYLKDRKRVREYNVDDITIWFIDPNIRSQREDHENRWKFFRLLPIKF